MTPSEIKHHQRRVLVFGNWVELLVRHGCSDHYCDIRTYKTGMHTNGGCKCYNRLADYGIELSDSADRLKNLCGLEPLHESAQEAEDALNSLGA